MNTYQDCVDYLYSLISYETKPNWSYDNKSLNLERFKKFLHRIGDPQNDLRIIHIAGSDGKGSTCAILTSVLQHAGFKTGLFTSPHLHSVRERIRINNDWIDKESFVYWTQYLRNELEAFSPGQTGFTTFFELLTAMGFHYFKQQQVDFAVMETGLGGRLDATNVGNPILCIITHISMEHAEKLGDTLEKIADEKLGIIRKNAPVIVGPQDETLLPHFKKRLEYHPSSVNYVDEEFSLLDTSILNAKRNIVFKDSHNSIVTLASPLLGYYQVQNVMTAYAAFSQLRERKWIPFTDSDMFQEGVNKTVWDGRFEVFTLPDGKSIVLDIAHTVKGALSLKRSLDDVFPNKKRSFILGFLKEKNYMAMIENLCNEEDFIILTEPPSPRAIPLDELQRTCSVLESKFDIRYEKEAASAFQAVIDTIDSNRVLVIAGSLYLVSHVRSMLTQEIED